MKVFKYYKSTKSKAKILNRSRYCYKLQKNYAQGKCTPKKWERLCYPSHNDQVIL